MTPGANVARCASCAWKISSGRGSAKSARTSSRVQSCRGMPHSRNCARSRVWYNSCDMMIGSAPEQTASMKSLDSYATEKLTELARHDLRRYPHVTDRCGGMWVTRNGRRLLSFSSNDYLQLSLHPAVCAAATAAIARYGTGSGA